jgi:hypothetical protein
MSLEVENVERLSFHQREDEVWHVAPSLVLRCHQHLQWLPKKEALLRNYTPTLVRANQWVTAWIIYIRIVLERNCAAFVDLRYINKCSLYWSYWSYILKQCFQEKYFSGRKLNALGGTDACLFHLSLQFLHLSFILNCLSHVDVIVSYVLHVDI